MVGQPLDRADEVEAFRVADELDRVTADAAAEAVVRAAVGRDGEGRRLLLVEGTQPGVAGTDLAQAGPRLDEIDDARRSLDRVYRRVLDPGHVRGSPRTKARSGRSCPRGRKSTRLNSSHVAISYA